MENKMDLSRELRSISILFTALCTSIFLFAGVSLVLNRINGPFLNDTNFSKTCLGVVVILSVICLVLAHFIYNKRIRSEIQPPLLLFQKLYRYRSILIMYIAILEGPAVFAIIGFLLTGYFRFLAITFILLLNMFLKRPSKMRMIADMQLSSSEKAELYK